MDMENKQESVPVIQNVLLLEPFYTGSHKQLIDLLHNGLLSSSSLSNHGTKVDLVTMRGKKWHWRARTSPLYFAQNIPRGVHYTTVFASSVLPLHELLSLRPELLKARKILYFHENQLLYPVRRSREARDFQYGYNQILSCLAADRVLFNSQYNMESFLSTIKSFFKVQPDYRPKHLRETIEPKCSVLYFPLSFTQQDALGPMMSIAPKNSNVYRILWPHRWEFDKNPDLFFQVLFKLLDDGVTNFRLSILGESFTENPPIFTEASTRLDSHIDHFGFLPSKADYYGVLRESDIVISTSNHEFFGVAMLEAVYAGAIPLCPNRLVYPEIFEDSPDSLFSTQEDLYAKLSQLLLMSPEGLIQRKSLARVDFKRFDWETLKGNYLSLFTHSIVDTPTLNNSVPVSLP